MGNKEVTKQEIVEYIIAQADTNNCKPTWMKDVGDAFQIAWNTKYYYYDIEVYTESVEFFFSSNRKKIEATTVKDIDDVDEKMIIKMLNRIFMEIKGQ
jgi:hypothetical protein